MIANYWTIHHSILQPLRRHDRRLIQLNLLWLALIVFLPFPTALIADGLDGGFATLYIGALLAVSILSLLLVTSPTSPTTPNSPMARQLLKAADTSRQAGSALPP